MKELSRRKHIRLKDYDYSNEGRYFITICSFQREHIFGDIVVGQGLCPCRLSDIGIIIDREIKEIEKRYINISVDKYVIMPNHVHLVISIRARRQGQSPYPTIGDIVRVIKSRTTKIANQKDSLEGRKIWQYRYYEHIIRNEKEYQRILDYIDTNPEKWNEDYYYINA